MALGGKVVSDRGPFVLVEKATTVALSEVAFKLAAGMRGSVADAYTWISKLAVQQWESDLQRAEALWQCIEAANGYLIEDARPAGLRPVSSVSQEVERLIMRQACSWLGVDPDSDCRRPPGRPPSAGEEGDFILVEVNKSNEVIGRLKKDFMGVRGGTDLAELGLLLLIEILGALRTQGLDIDAAAPDWREQGASYAAAGGSGEGATPDPYEVLGVPRDAPMDDIVKSYRRIMQWVHPDLANVSDWFARVAAAAYRTIRQERGETA
ncbi:J domain-containing protein [Noviherbaspirillum soli]|uniref:J domain-containing protein n=1 Tax=Noviherbaspirillum soli TaxID=1064518 RepID=UPI002B27B8B7|nr:J domain-containing protein [Noviherbaspirillum soli]